jgi:hypothetical protein
MRARGEVREEARGKFGDQVGRGQPRVARLEVELGGDRRKSREVVLMRPPTSMKNGRKVPRWAMVADSPLEFFCLVPSSFAAKRKD